MSLKDTNGNTISLSDDEQKLLPTLKKENRDIAQFLQGAVYSWCGTNKDREFCFADLFGGMNRDWRGTSLQEIYNSNTKSMTGDDAYEESKKNAGWFLKLVLYKDNRYFVFLGKKDNRNFYRWTPPA